MIRGIGTDVIEVARLEAMTASSGERFLTRWFTDRELEHCRAKAFPARHLAARLAAKESVVKALRLSRGRSQGWRDIEVVLDSAGAPGIAMHGTLSAEVPADCRWHVSLSHTGQYATAVALLEEHPHG